MYTISNDDIMTLYVRANNNYLSENICNGISKIKSNNNKTNTSYTHIFILSVEWNRKIL